MKIIFFGSGKFAVSVLDAIKHSGAADRDVCLVVTQPDRKKGRHLSLGATPVKEYTLSHRWDIFQPEDINSASSVKTLNKYRADVFIVVSYGRILSKKALSLPKELCVNIHASLLPKYRGAAPIQWALIYGEIKTGVSFIRMNERMDEGDILYKKEINIDPLDRADTLEEKLAALASSNIDKVLRSIENNKLRSIQQNDKDSSNAPRIKKQDGLIHWDASSKRVYDSFRGCFGWPGSYCYYNGKMLKIIDMEPTQNTTTGKPGEIVDIKMDSLEVACRVGSILIKEVLPESHHKMTVKSFLAGHQIKISDKLTSMC
ncbi:MAG: methionyl-tRNA formyltransferase [Candidatus Omnitrophica bacterium CG1_02_44_16]|nr:MAG: methionyl-tRNA formyltransferase [Candidatus Omnitrophica bacterium CG1_02_44_16]PIY83049.1 MAG: methionyl-tRNA formyltransferase [Candidatus Omnitrophica bacterium CG_4_10_14_0_8_um_filter_44_12]PIZ83376.1 MAG: methionyl-tRNA formyltransferase [Candidatus Omnitrophica bacterium CG_4_10_14_0_2_um_filter_44_9]